MERFKKYSFWVGVAGALLVLLEAIANALGFGFNEPKVEAILLGICTLMVALGFIKKDDKENMDSSQNDSDENIDI